MISIGITGGIACGKSTILQYIHSLGYEVFSSDDAFREMFNHEHIQAWLKDKIIEMKGHSGFEEYQTAGRTFIKYLVLSDAIFKREYENFVHPLVIQQMNDSKAKIAEVPLLFESGLESHFQHIWVIACQPEIQISRLMQRLNCDRDYALAWINNQMPLKKKIEKAGRVIYTDGTLEDIQKIVKQALCEDLNEKH